LDAFETIGIIFFAILCLIGLAVVVIIVVGVWKDVSSWLRNRDG
jgi:hypothetical protein